MKKKITALLIGLLCSTQAFSAITCTGSVRMLALGPAGGVVQADTGFGVWYLCSVAATSGGIPPESCKAIYTMLLTAQSTGRQVSLYFDNTGSPNLSCATLGNWVSPSPLPYFMHMVP